MHIREKERFEFGKNWAQYATLVSTKRIDQAKSSILDFIPLSKIQGSTVIDVGSGSGLFSVAAGLLGAQHVTAIDYDPNSVATTQSLLEAYVPSQRWTCRQQDVLTTTPEKDGTYDIVYSWGVLHHTGDMYNAICHAAALVSNEGYFFIALYGKTPFCLLWKGEKWCYVNVPLFKKIFTPLYKGLVMVRLLLAGRRPLKYIKHYQTQRGMDWHRDITDWLGGYPYESISPKKIEDLMGSLGLVLEKSKTKKRLGLFGSGCDEYVFRKVSKSPAAANHPTKA